MPKNGYASIRCCALKVLMLANSICGDTAINSLIRLINPSLPNGISRPYHLKEFLVLGGNFHFFQIL